MLFLKKIHTIIDGNIDNQKDVNECNDDQRFNTEKHHKQQHKF